MSDFLRRLGIRAISDFSFDAALIAMLLLAGDCGGVQAAPVSEAWQQKVSGLVWVAYFPTQANPNTGLEPTRASIDADLTLLRKAGFTGLVTYGSSGFTGRELPALAEANGFGGLIVGVWDPKNAGEMAAAKGAASSRIVLGYCVGNEGMNERYRMSELSSAMQNLREATGKPVTTAEQIEKYDNEVLRQAGDWVFPNAHPYFNHELDPIDAVPWTLNAYNRLVRRSDRFVFFKEVGLPTAGRANEKLSEANQDKYYAELARTSVRFVFFEAFDLPWKNNLPVEPHWGIFRPDRSPKVLGQRLLGTESSGAKRGGASPLP
jgi:exo-beta-1,3-glucanase (GH17 family)